MYRNTYVEIDTDIIAKNVQNIISKYNDYQYYIGIIKKVSDKYGNDEKITKTIYK